VTAQTWNDITTAIGSDGWNVVAHMKGLADTADVVVSVASQAERDGLAALAPGGVLPIPTTVYRTDLGRTETWDGVEWAGNVRHAEINYATASVPNNTAWGPGIGSIDATRSQYSGFATTPINDHIEVSKAGVYAIDWYMVVSGIVATPVFAAINRGATRIFGQQYAAGFENTPSVPNIHMNAGERFKLIMVQTSGAAVDITHNVRVTRVG
jgi:hypothetical protein